MIRKLSLTEMIASWRRPMRTFNEADNERAHWMDTERFRLADELEAALAQQAQPLTDQEIEFEADCFACSSFAPRRTKKDAYARGMRSARDRMDQQAQPCIDCGSTGPMCDGLTVCVKCFEAAQQAQPEMIRQGEALFERSNKRDQQAQPDFMEQGLAIYDKHRPGLNAGLNTQPEVPTREMIGNMLIQYIIRYPMPTVGDCWGMADAVLALFAPKHPDCKVVGAHGPHEWPICDGKSYNTRYAGCPGAR